MKNNFLTKKLLIGIILLLFVILFAFLITNGYFNLNRDVKKRKITSNQKSDY